MFFVIFLITSGQINNPLPENWTTSGESAIRLKYQLKKQGTIL